MPRSVFDIFLSSTSEDFRDCREKVREMIERMRQTTIRMETFGAKPATPLVTCREEVEKCDALIVIVGHRYGWVPSKSEGGDDEKSITWWEVQWALDAKKPVYAFLIDPKAPWNAQREQDRLIDARDEKQFVEIGRSVQRLQEFRALLDKFTTREVFTSAEDLAGKVASSLHPWLLEQAVAAARASYSQDRAQAQSILAISRAVPGAVSLAEPDQLYWQEQVHLLSAQRFAGSGEGVRLALIAGWANTEHPALSGTSVKQFNVRSGISPHEHDDFTTALAALLVGSGLTTSYRGIAPRAQLLVLNVLDEQSRSWGSEIIVALDAAILEGAQVICLPFGIMAGLAMDADFHDVISEPGVLVVCPAGNNSSDKPIYPAAGPHPLSAAALDTQNRLATFSNWGDWVTTAAPGKDVPIAVGKNSYGKMSGTVMACGILAGTVALMLAVNPKLAPVQVREILRRTGASVSTPDGMQALGQLRVLDAMEAVRAAAKAGA